MTQPPKYTMTNDSISLMWEGKSVVVQKGTPNFIPLRDALTNERWDDIPKCVSVSKSLDSWAKGKFTIDSTGEHFLYEGKNLPQDFNNRIIKMATSNEDPTPLFKFWERLQKNPSFRSVQQLWPFMAQQGIPLTKDGCILTYKGVTSDYKDVHTNSVDNSIGTTHEMPRNQISDDPKIPCHVGFHVGAYSYATSFGPRTIICKVDPEDVVCVPYDNEQQKMRVCRYKVVGNGNGQHMSSTVISSSDYESNEELDGTTEAVEEEPDGTEDIDYGNEVGDDDQGHTGEKEAPVLRHHAKKGWAKFDKMDMAALMNQSLDDLRQYAGKGLDIVGASKIAGGKTALVAKILQVRS